MNAPEVRKVVKDWIADRVTGVDLGLPEKDDRKGVWRVALVTEHNGMEPVGEVRVLNGEVIFSSNLEMVAKRIKRTAHKPKRESQNKPIAFRPLHSRLVLGDAGRGVDGLSTRFCPACFHLTAILQCQTRSPMRAKGMKTT